MDASLSDVAGVDTTVYASYDGGDGTGQKVGTGQAWHRRISSEVWLWLIVVGAIGFLWIIGGSFRKILS